MLIVGTLGFLIYSKYFNKPVESPIVTTPSPSPIPTPSPTPTNPAPSPSAGSTLVKLTDEADGQIVSPVLWFNGEAINYFDNKGNLYVANFYESQGRLSLTGKKLIAIPSKANIVKVLWPSQTRDFIVQLKDGAGIVSYSYFNYDSATFTDLPKQVKALDWMPNGTQIMYVWVEGGKATLSLANPDTKNYKDLAEMWETDNAIHISPNADQLLYFQTQNTGDTNPINSVTADGKVWKALVKTGQNFGVLWSPDGQRFLFGKRDIATQKYQLWVYNLTLGEVRNLGLNTTVEKAVWGKDSNTIYASVPNSGGVEENTLTVDSFFQMDINSLEKKQYAAAATAVDGRDLFLNSLGDKLFFKNAQDGALYYLDLNQ